MKVIVPESISTEELNDLAHALENYQVSSNPDIRAAAQKVKDHYVNTSTYSQEVQEAMEEVFCTGKYTVTEMALFIRELTRERISPSFKTYPLFQEIVKSMSEHVRRARASLGY